MAPEQPRLLPGKQPPIHHALKSLPNFDGDPVKVQGFCQAIRDLCHLYGVESEYWIRNNVGKLLKGRAEIEFGSQLLEYNSLEELLNDLTTRYRNRESTENILFEMKTIRQKPGEGAGDYGHRTQALLKRLLRAHDADGRMPENAETYHKGKGERETLE